MIKKINNFIIELNISKITPGIIIEISKKEMIDNNLVIEKEYMFYETRDKINIRRVMQFIKEYTSFKDLKDLIR